MQLVYTYDSNKDDNEITELLSSLTSAGIVYRDIHTDQDSLEDIFIQLVKAK